IERYSMQNGLSILLCEDKSAPVVSVHTWFRVGSRHEVEGKTGLAHLFEHLMFNEIEGRGPGEFDRTLEEAGAESNASTWLDWTQYNIAIPKEQLGLVLTLESERMSKLVLREPQVTSEKEVVANERRYRVDDDVEGAVNELLWATAFTKHAYKWPTIGWMKDIEGFTTEDCEAFYRAYYAPNNAALVISGDFKTADVLRLISERYGTMPASTLPIEDAQPEPPQTSERRLEVRKATSTEKLLVGYHSPALGDFDHPAISLLSEVLFGGRASRLHQRMVRELELASEVRGSVGPFHDPGLFEVYAAAREGHTAEELLAVLDEELKKVIEAPVTAEEMARASARFELGLLGGLETADGKASTIGFYEAVLGRPAAAFERLDATRRLTQSDLLRAARRYLDPNQRSVILVRPDLAKPGAEAAE
ncbi:MAG TPA: pitrilysin family protein, partial [Polyangiaceae bacterium]|nr:pitrilysin family protein [Polyangiaceae bacterium]